MSTNNGDEDDEENLPPFYKKKEGTSSSQQAPSEQQFPAVLENISGDRRGSFSLADWSRSATPSPGQLELASDYSIITDQTSTPHLSSTQESNNLPGFGLDSDMTFSASSLSTSQDPPSHLHTTLDSSYPNLSSSPQGSLSTDLSGTSFSPPLDDLTDYARETVSYEFSNEFRSGLGSSSSYPDNLSEYPYSTGQSDYLSSGNPAEYSFDNNPSSYSSSGAGNSYFKY
ncbi:hypothetical protein QBC37DRAFT_176813 [Rhypophila decipiens]|uniref:Uncharacterized protein n=1 Tax=Rhypophila decipiens TaxID=261697 RepID=A0AAN6YIH8_9PEZI|nr:hypothetical protein QBC37DRAFT_176813 [Rhypophila decipiens]